MKINKPHVEEINRIWSQLLAQQNAHRPSVLSPDHQSFINYAWNKFNSYTVIDTLLSKAPSYFAHKDILFSGLCTWMVCPQRQDLINAAMLLEAIYHMERMEKLGQAAFPSDPLLGDIIARVMVPGSDFYKDFYYPIGGLTAVAKSVSRTTFEITVQERSFETPTIPAMVSVFHFHSENLRGNKKYHKASVNKARHAVIKLSHYRGKRTVAPDNITKRWEKFRGSAALMYAASTLLVPDQENERRKTLFDAARDGTANFDAHGHLIPEWIARARFVSQHVLAHCHKGREIADKNEATFPGGQEMVLPPDVFTEEEVAIIEKAFSATAPRVSRRLKT